MTWDTKQVKLELRPEAGLSPSGRNSFSIESKNCKNATPRWSAEAERVCVLPLAGPPPHSANTLSASAFGLHTAGLGIPALEGRVSTPYICAAPLAHRDRTRTPRAAEQARD